MKSSVMRDDDGGVRKAIGLNQSVDRSISLTKRGESER